MQQAQAGTPPALTCNPTHLEQQMQRCWQHACQGSNFLIGMPSLVKRLALYCRGAGRGGCKALDMNPGRSTEEEHAAQFCKQVTCRDSAHEVLIWAEDVVAMGPHPGRVQDLLTHKHHVKVGVCSEGRPPGQRMVLVAAWPQHQPEHSTGAHTIAPHSPNGTSSRDSPGAKMKPAPAARQPAAGQPA